MFKLALNAGHGMNTPGKRCLKKLDKKETREWYLNSRICEKIEEKLKGFSDVCILRLDDKTGYKDIRLKKRTDVANSFGADFYLSIHHNAGIKGGEGGGIVAYVYTNASNESKLWQRELYASIIKKTKLKGNRANGISSANFHECRESSMPCVLLECGFMDSKTDLPIILSNSFAENVATACVEVIVKKANLKPGLTSPKRLLDNIIFEWQNAAQKDGFKFPKYGADGKWGDECYEVAKAAVCKKRAKYKYINLTEFIQEVLGIEVDGKFGKATMLAVKNFQKENKLLVDGCVGISTWKKLLGVKE